MTAGLAFDSLVSMGARRRYPAGSMVFAEGDPSATVFVVLEGEIALEFADGAALADGGGRILLGPGELLGELGAMDGLPRSATARAAVDSMVVAVPSASFVRLLEEQPQLMLGLARAVAARLRSSTQHDAFDAGGLPVAELARELVRCLDQESGSTISIGVGELANRLGVSREVLSRAVDHLAGRGAVAQDRGLIQVLDPISLARASG